MAGRVGARARGGPRAGRGESDACERARVQEDLPHVSFSDPDPIPVFERIYPYFRFDRYTNDPVDRAWTVVELENTYLRVLVLPEIGGKVWTAIDKTSGRAFIYDNHVVKFREGIGRISAHVYRMPVMRPTVP